MLIFDPPRENLADDEVNLRIIATTDLHMRAVSFDYGQAKPTDDGSLARLAPLIESLRSRAANVLLLDNGDVLQGTPVSEFLARNWTARDKAPHPMITAMEGLGFDAGNLGNHDFDFGLPYLHQAVALARFPILCANVLKVLPDGTPSNEPVFQPYALTDREVTQVDGSPQNLRIGILGLVPPQTAKWNAQNLAGNVAIPSIPAAAARYLPEMRAAGADICIALCHSGIGHADADQWDENVGLILAQQGGIDALILGHSHEVFPALHEQNSWRSDAQRPGGVDAVRGHLHGIPTVLPGYWGNHLGVIDLVLKKAAGRWSVLRDAARVVSPERSGAQVFTATETLAAQQVSDAVADLHAQTLRHLRTPVGRSEAHLHSYFGLVQFPPSLDIVAQSKIWYARRAVPTSQEPVLAFVSPFKCGGRHGPQHYVDIPPGALELRHIAELYPFPNTLAVVRETGAKLRQWLERTAGHYAQIPVGAQDAQIFLDDIPSYEFDLLAGLTYQIDLTKRPGEGRVSDIRCNGALLSDDQSVLIATDSYRLAARHGAVQNDQILARSKESARDILADFVRSKNEVAPIFGPVWRFAPCDAATTARFKTGPRARDLIAAEPALTLLSEDADGWLHVRMALPAATVPAHAAAHSAASLI